MLFISSIKLGAQSVPRGHDLPKFLGREVTIIEPEREDDFFPKGPATVCIEGPPQRQCYTAPKEFGNNPTVALIDLDKDTPALFFSAASGGISGIGIHFALLVPGADKELEDLFPSDIAISNQGRFAFWSDPVIAGTPIFITADFVWGPGESHYDEHRYMVSAYLRATASDDPGTYYLQDRYMTVRKYDVDANPDILASEKQEILARLRR